MVDAAVLRSCRSSWCTGLAISALLSSADNGADQTGPPADPVIFAADLSVTGSPPFQWDREGVWSIRDHQVHAVLPEKKQLRSFAYFGSEDWTDYAVDLDVCGVRGVDKGVALRIERRKALVVDLRGSGYDDVVMYRGYTRLGHHPVVNPNGSWNHLRVELRGSRYRVLVNGQLVIDHEEPHNKRPRGRLALLAYSGGDGHCEVLYSNIIVRSLL